MLAITTVTETLPQTYKEVLEILRELPGSTAREVHQLMSHVSLNEVQTKLSYLYRKGIVEELPEKKSVDVGNGKTRRVTAYAISEHPIPKTPKRKQKSPTEVGLYARIEELKEQIATLEKWKENAITRFPELSVDPLVLVARKMVAEELRASGDMAMANHVERGDKDDSLPMRVTIKALEAHGV